METEGSLPCSQKPVTGPTPELDASSNNPHAKSHLRLVLPSSLLHSGFSTKSTPVFLIFPWKLHALSISVTFSLLPW
jgi:hypothetical protein